jgi:uncharacterized membrane protein
MMGFRVRVLFIGLFILSALVLLIGFESRKDDEARRGGKEVSFSKDVTPLLAEHCRTCHMKEHEHPSEFYVDSYEDMMNESRHGKTIIPGYAQKSILYQKLLPEPTFGRTMPPSKKRKLTPEQIDLIKRWIDQGAKKN